MPTDIFKETYQSALDEASAAFAANADDVHAKALAIALGDKGVTKLILDYLKDGYPFLGHDFPHSTDPELVAVKFKFACKIGTICIKPPFFTAVVNLTTQKVVGIDDPFHQTSLDEDVRPKIFCH